MSSIKLASSHFTVGTSNLYLISPSWVSNGHWAIRKSRLQNAALFETEASLRAAVNPKRGTQVVVKTDDSQIDRMVEAIGPTPLTYTITSWTHGDKTPLALATCDAEYAFYDRRYLTLIGAPSTLYARDSTSAATDAIEPAERTILLMPFSDKHTATLLEPLTSLVHLLDLKVDEQAREVA